MISGRGGCHGDEIPRPANYLHHLQEAIPIIEAEDRFLPLFMAEASETKDAGHCREILAWMASMGGWVKKTELGQHPKFGPLGKKKRDELMEDMLDSQKIVMAKGTKGGVWYGLFGVEKTERVK